MNTVLRFASLMMVVLSLASCGAGGGGGGGGGSTSVGNRAPTASAGPAQSVMAAATVQLDGTASNDPDGNPLNYLWTLTARPAGSSAVLSSTSVARPTFVADVAGSYLVTLIVNDGSLPSGPATVAITAAAVNAAPVANAGTSRDVVIGAVVQLNGGASTDANGDALTYRWALTSKPAGSTAALSSTTVVTPSFTADVAGAYVVSLIVNDGQVDSAAVTVTITAVNPIAPLPVGAGNYLQLYPAATFYAVDDRLGTLTAAPDSCRGFDSADTRPDGVVLAVSLTSATLTAVDVLAGRCLALFAVAEPMKAIAVAADGTIVMISGASTTGTYRVYRYRADGILLGSMPVSGVSNRSGISDLTSPAGIDFAPDGTLYASNAKAIWRLDPVSGVGTLVAIDVQSQGDIDIDSAGVFRSFAFGLLYRYNSTSWSLIDTTTLTREIPDRSPLIRR